MTQVDAQQDTYVGRGAEATLTRTKDGIVKSRPVKAYRHPRLDAHLRKSRTKTEARLLEKAKQAGVNVPDVKIIDEATLLLSAIRGVMVKEVLDGNPIIAHEVGRQVGRLHDKDIIHADLTTSNMLYDHETHKVIIIDFGLSYTSIRDEDKAVDLHLFHQSLESKHHRVLALAYRHFLKGYRDTAKNAETIINRLRVVESRGRNKGS